MAKKGAMPTYATVDDYIAQQSETAQAVLQEIRSIIHQAVPETEEGKNYKVATFRVVPEADVDQQIMVAAYAKFVGFYPFPNTMEAFSEDLKDYKQGKGSVQFPYNKPLPKELIARMVEHRKVELSTRS